MVPQWIRYSWPYILYSTFHSECVTNTECGKIFQGDFPSYYVIRNFAAFALGGATHCSRNKSYYPKSVMPRRGPMERERKTPGRPSALLGLPAEAANMAVKKSLGFSGPVEPSNDFSFNCVWLPSHETPQVRTLQLSLANPQNLKRWHEIVLKPVSLSWFLYKQ